MRGSEEILKLLLEGVSSMEEVQSIGISGGNGNGKLEIPEAGHGDVDVFIYCSAIPDAERRNVVLRKLQPMLGETKTGVFEGGHWGVGDFTLINGVETWLMYFTIEENGSYVDEILKGIHPDKVDNYFYPVGRCAMLRNINVMYDKERYLEDLKIKLMEYPEELKEMLVRHHLEELEDVEDLERAAAREDVLFYHFSLDIAVDHFLQALFAMNRSFFPSRKRSLDYISRFECRPEDCSSRLMDIIRLGGTADGIKESYSLWRELVGDLRKCAEA